jgi:hypothetical protein
VLGGGRDHTLMVGCRDRQNWQSIFAFCRRTGHQQTIATPTHSKRWRGVAARHTLTITAVRSLACTRMLHIHLRNLPRDQGVGYGGARTPDRPTLLWSAVSPTQKSKKLAHEFAIASHITEVGGRQERYCEPSRESSRQTRSHAVHIAQLTWHGVLWTSA